MSNFLSEPIRYFLVLLGSLLVFGCGAPEKAYRVQVYDVPGEAGLKGHQKPYSVNGEVYKPLRNHEDFVEDGIASWYGPDFHGKKTSCGETYDMHAMTAAHKILPLGVHVKVTNRDNGRSVVVRVNDRGPFVKGRVIDLSFAAAKELDMTVKGTAPVKIEALGYSVVDTTGSITYSQPKSYDTGRYTVQIGAFVQLENAQRLSKKMRERYGVSTIQQGYVKGNLFYRVRVGNYSSIETADAAIEAFEQEGFSSCFVVAFD